MMCESYRQSNTLNKKTKSQNTIHYYYYYYYYYNYYYHYYCYYYYYYYYYHYYCYYYYCYYYCYCYYYYYYHHYYYCYYYYYHHHHCYKNQSTAIGRLTYRDQAHMRDAGAHHNKGLHRPTVPTSVIMVTGAGCMMHVEA